MSRQLHLNLFIQSRGHHEASWRHPLASPLPLTDVIIHPKDGAMYFTVGGRRTQSALYRVTYTGTESTAPAKALAPTKEALVRRSLEE